jgi:hypothetical protein
MTNLPTTGKTSQPDPVATGPVADDDNQDTSLLGTFTYGLSLPERTARSASAIVGGLVHETAGWLLPVAFRSSKTYSTFVQQALDMMIHDLGGVDNPDAAETPEDETLLARQAVGGLLDLAGAATLHLSPITVLAVFSDVAYGSNHYLKCLSDELKREGIIGETSSIDSVSDLIAALEKSSSSAAEAANAPPMSVDGMTETIRKISGEIAAVDPRKLIPQHEIRQLWSEMETTANQANVGLWQVSTTMTMFAIDRLSLSTRGALSTVRVAGSLLDAHLLSHYHEALSSISQKGLYVTLADSSRPYLEAVWRNFDAARETWTEAVITGKMPRRWWNKCVAWIRSRFAKTS